MERARIVKSRGRILCDMVNTETPDVSYSEKTTENNNISLTQIELDSFSSSNVCNITSMILFFHFVVIFI